MHHLFLASVSQSLHIMLMRSFLHSIFLTTFVSLVLLVSMPAQAEHHGVDSLKVSALLAEGDVFYRRLDNKLAIASYRQAFALDSTSFDVLSRLARTANDLGRDLHADQQNSAAEDAFFEAVRYADLLLIDHANSVHTHYYLALTKGNLALFQGGRKKIEFAREIEQHCLEGLRIDSTHAELMVAFGVFKREVASSTWMERTFAKALFGEIPQGTKENAVELLTRAVALRPELHIARFELALSLIAVGQPEEAMTHLKAAQSLPAQTTQDNRNRQLAERMLARMSQ